MVDLYPARAGPGREPAPYDIVGTVIEVLRGCGMATILTRNSALYTISRDTDGIDFKKLRVGQRLGCRIEPPFQRVVHAHYA